MTIQGNVIQIMCKSSRESSRDRLRKLINASNLHVGGGVQVAASVLTEASCASFGTDDVAVAISNEVENALPAKVSLSSTFCEVIRLNISGLNLWNRRASKVLDQFDVVFTLFGPLYRLHPPFRSIVGFAQPWIIYPNSEAFARLSLTAKFITRVKYWIQAYFFKQADLIVVELEHVKDALVRELGVAPKNVVVIHNCVASFYREPDLWQPVSIPDTGDAVRLGFLGRNYPHKNTQIFPEIIGCLKDSYGIDARFLVTFTQEEWGKCSGAFRSVCTNIGPIAPLQCPLFYEAIDVVVFPSLLECFSATPLEAMAMARPLIVSDRAFNRDVCGQYAHYFNPLCARDAAKAIASVIQHPGPAAACAKAAQKHALSFSSPERRAAEYVALLKAGETLDS